VLGSVDLFQSRRLDKRPFPDVIDEGHGGIELPLIQGDRHTRIDRRHLGCQVLLKQRFRGIAQQGLVEVFTWANELPHTNGPEPCRVTVSQRGVPLEVSAKRAADV